MLFSCKITNALLNFVDRQGGSLEPFYEGTDLPREFLQDPSYWLEADRLEHLVKSLENEYSGLVRGSVVTQTGHATPELRSWGVLDSVLRMLQRPQDVFSQPERFLSYFISPAPPIGQLIREEEWIQFEVPVDSGQYPYVTQYLQAAIESLPTYVGQAPFKVRWDGTQVTIHWSERQETLFTEKQREEMNLNPELVHRVMHELEEHQKQVEGLQRELHIKQKEIDSLRAQLDAEPEREESSWQLPGEDFIQLVQTFRQASAGSRNDFYRLQDYFTRAQQLITLLIGQGRADTQVREAMKRVDWERVQSDYPQKIKQVEGQFRSFDAFLAKCERSFSDLPSEARPVPASEEIERIVDLVEANLPESSIRIHRHIVLDADVRVDRQAFQQAIHGLLELAVLDVRNGGDIRVVARPRAGRAEIEITDAAAAPVPKMGKDQKVLFEDGLRKVRTALQKQRGQFAVRSEAGGGHTFLVDLPLA